MMKIRYLVTSLEGGGGTFTLPSIIDVFRKYGCDVKLTACELRDGRAAELLQKAGIDYDLLSISKRNKLYYIKKFFVMMLKDRPDIIVTSLRGGSLVGQVVGKLLRIPVVSWLNNTKKKKYTRYLKNYPLLWIADSQSVEKFLYDEMQIPKDKVRVWPLFRTTHTQSVKQHYWNGNSSLIIGSTGRLSKEKNYLPLLKAVHSLIKIYHGRFNIKLFIAGDGPQREELQSYIERHHLNANITLLGHIDNVPEFLKTLDIYVQPSLYEGMCLAVHEAMEIGLPVVATPVGEMKHTVVEKQAGLEITGDIENSIVTHICDLIENPEKQRLYSQRGRKAVEACFGEEQFSKTGQCVVQFLKDCVSYSKK
ncbi:LOW QUALITY PROTEIN: glycosyl transferase family 1 [Zymomonas mobilis]|nr:LOW QUALITY PROTEIN: glycosyl transferase family 1 [Zymomonas mobilis]